MTLPRWQVPETWKWAQASEVADIVGGGTPSTKDETNFAEPGLGVPWVGPADLTGYNDVYIGRGRRDLSEKGLSSSGATLMPKGTVLFSSRAPIGYCAIAANNISTNQGFKSWVCASDVMPEYVRHYLLSSIEYADSLASGTTFREVSGKRVGAMAFPVAPAAEQRRIVAKLDALTARLARARAELDRVPVLARHLRAAALLECFAGWTAAVPLSDILKDIEAGKNLRCEERPPQLDENGVVKVSAVTWGRFDPSQSKTLPSDYAPPAKALIREGDLLISRANTLELVGAVVIVDESPERLYLSDKILRLVMPDTDKQWVMWFLRSPLGREQIEQKATGNQLSMRNISQSALRSISIPYPDIKVRMKNVDLLEAAFARADRMEAEATRARALIDRLEAAILGRAFRGELVPQDPDDEPAHVLLDRIRAERAARAAAAAKPKRGRAAKVSV